MPYALIPDGYSLEKVTKAQEQALKDKRRHDDVVTVLNNPEIIKQIIITGFAFLAVREGKEALSDLKTWVLILLKILKMHLLRKDLLAVRL